MVVHILIEKHNKLIGWMPITMYVTNPVTVNTTDAHAHVSRTFKLSADGHLLI